MFYENKLLCTILFLFCLFGAIFSQKNPEQVQAKSVSVETETQTGKVEKGLSKPLANSGTISKPDPKEGRKNCDSVCKSLELQRLGIIEPIANSLITNCKALSTDPRKCIIIGAFIVKVESSGGNRCKKSNKYNCFGLSVKENYKSYNDGVIHFVGRYNRYWYKQKTPDSFYSNSPDWQPVTKFCLSEYSSGLPYCKNGHNTAWEIYKKLENYF